MIHHLHIKIEEVIHRINKEIGVFEVREQKEVDKDAHDYTEFLPSFFTGMMDQIPQVIV